MHLFVLFYIRVSDADIHIKCVFPLLCVCLRWDWSGTVNVPSARHVNASVYRSEGTQPRCHLFVALLRQVLVPQLEERRGNTPSGAIQHIRNQHQLQIPLNRVVFSQLGSRRARSRLNHHTSSVTTSITCHWGCLDVVFGAFILIRALFLG